MLLFLKGKAGVHSGLKLVEIYFILVIFSCFSFCYFSYLMSEGAVFVNPVFKIFWCLHVCCLKEWKHKLQGPDFTHIHQVCFCVLVLKTTKNGSLPELPALESLWRTVFCLDCVSEVLIQIFGEFEAVVCGVDLFAFHLVKLLLKQNNIKISL